MGGQVQPTQRCLPRAVQAEAGGGADQGIHEFLGGRGVLAAARLPTAAHLPAAAGVGPDPEVVATPIFPFRCDTCPCCFLACAARITSISCGGQNPAKLWATVINACGKAGGLCKEPAVYGCPLHGVVAGQLCAMETQTLLLACLFVTAMHPCQMLPYSVSESASGPPYEPLGALHFARDVRLCSCPGLSSGPSVHQTGMPVFLL